MKETQIWNVWFFDKNMSNNTVYHSSLLYLCLSIAVYNLGQSVH